MKLSLWALVAALFVCAAAKAAPPPLSVYGSLPGLELAAISPSGQHVALIGTVDDTRRLVILDDQGHIVKQTPLGSPRIRTMTWAGEDQVLVYFRRIETTNYGVHKPILEFDNLVVVPTTGDDKPWPIFEKISTIRSGVQSTQAILQRGGRWYGYFIAVDSQSPSRALYEVDLQTKDIRILAHPTIEPPLRLWRVGGDGKILASIEYH
jgi:hypothetical protein